MARSVVSRWALVWAWVVVLALGAPAWAGKYNPVLSPGDAAPSWSELPGVDDRAHSLAELESYDVVVLVFTCNSCPIAQDYEDRMIELAARYAEPNSRVKVVAVNVNKIEEDRLPAMKKRAAERKFPFAYLFDESQQIAKDYGATYTPEFFVLDRERRVVFLGGMDNNSDPAQVTERYLEPAIEAALAGKAPEVAEAPARGCAIRYERERRRKKPAAE